MIFTRVDSQGQLITTAACAPQDGPLLLQHVSERQWRQLRVLWLDDCCVHTQSLTPLFQGGINDDLAPLAQVAMSLTHGPPLFHGHPVRAHVPRTSSLRAAAMPASAHLVHWAWP